MPYIRKTYLLALSLGLVSLFYLISHADYITTYRPHGHSQAQGPLFDTALFSPGTPKSEHQNYSMALVLGRTSKEDISWISSELPNLPTAIYTVDDPRTALPTNKGHEAMVYLTYIIDHYSSLPDIVLFFHAHRFTWHNNILLEIDAVETIQRLSPAHVVRQGYFNTRCHLDPGCPNWLHVDRSRWLFDYKRKPEEPFLTSNLFHALHPDANAIPPAISQPCCAQFAVSGERIRSRPRETYTHYRDWLLHANLSDATSGRIMEYSWQYIFTGLFEFCPAQHECYCDGYGICFGGESGLNHWLSVLKSKEKLDEKLMVLWDKGQVNTPRYRELYKQESAIAEELERLKAEAVKRGLDPQARAVDCGRKWKEGDGY